MRAAIPPLPNTPSWRGVQLKHRATLPLPLELSFIKNIFTRSFAMDISEDISLQGGNTQMCF
jgi:hypothetical protein